MSTLKGNPMNLIELSMMHMHMFLMSGMCLGYLLFAGGGGGGEF
jgi:hypothetical protein